MTLVDSNVGLDIVLADPTWSSWSLGAFEKRATAGMMYYNDIIFAEVSALFRHWTLVEKLFQDLEITHIEFRAQILHRAAVAFKSYRRSGGAKASILPDFLIGAQAEAMNLVILTRDVRRYRTYFPKVDLITP